MSAGTDIDGKASLWLTDGTAAAQAEHDAEYAAGHEWRAEV